MNFFLNGLTSLLLVSVISILLNSDTEALLKPKDEYWGPGEQPDKIDESIRPFKIVFDKEMIDDLKMRLNNTRKLQPTLENVGWSYGVNSEFVPRFVDYWMNKYDFEKREKLLNKYPQFITNIQGLDIHYVHVKPKLPNDRKIQVIPLYIQHGWPTSVMYFRNIIPLLTTVRPDRDFVFELIIPALPGFGYSSTTTKPGLGPIEMATIMKNLMLRIGFTKWYSQGNGAGSFIIDNMAAMYPEHFLGMHSSFCFLINPEAFVIKGLKESLNLVLSSGARKNLMQKFIDNYEITGYLHIQTTKPETLGVAMSDSPAGFAAYVLEKFASSSKHDEHEYGDDKSLLEKGSLDDLLDNIMMFWAPNKITSSMRLYAEFASKRSLYNEVLYAPIKVPIVCMQTPKAMVSLPKDMLRYRYKNIVSMMKLKRGGHFIAREEPELFSDNIWAAIEKILDQESAENAKKTPKNSLHSLIAEYVSKKDSRRNNKRRLKIKDEARE